MEQKVPVKPAEPVKEDAGFLAVAEAQTVGAGDVADRVNGETK